MFRKFLVRFLLVRVWHEKCRSFCSASTLHLSYCYITAASGGAIEKMKNFSQFTLCFILLLVQDSNPLAGRGVLEDVKRLYPFILDR
jgi:hypothetical protein